MSSVDVSADPETLTTADDGKASTVYRVINWATLPRRIQTELAHAIVITVPHVHSEAMDSLLDRGIPPDVIDPDCQSPLRPRDRAQAAHSISDRLDAATSKVEPPAPRVAPESVKDL